MCSNNNRAETILESEEHYQIVLAKGLSDRIQTAETAVVRLPIHTKHEF
jgi:hypothetical protein